MFVGALRFDFRIAYARTLKDKRMVVQRFRDRVRSRFPVSVAEVGYQDNPTRALFGVAVVASDSRVLSSMMEQIVALASTDEDAALLRHDRECFPFGDDMFGDRDG